ncbi:MAG: HAD family hydrolase [Candidatus Dadabacteria bacterium]|nr:MAG: HAD family hydrolase [Candidatus Dadabacteria bacterium]
MKALLADLDGTLADTAPGLVAAAIAAAESLGAELLERDVAKLRPAAAQGATRLLTAMVGHHPADLLVENMLDHYEAIIADQTRLFPGTESWLALPRFAIVTNKPWRFARHLLGSVLPAEVLLVCPDHAGARKPDPAPVTFALERLGVRPEQAVLVGDDPADRDAAVRAGGVGFVAALWGYGAGAWMDEGFAKAASPADVQAFL